MIWKNFELEDVVKVEIGKTPSRSNPKYWDKDKKSSNVWVSIRDMSNNKDIFIDDSKEYISDEGAKLFKEVPRDTLIMSFKLSIGKLAITKKKIRTNEAIASLKIKDPKILKNKFLFYYLSSINWDILAGSDIKLKGKTLNKAKLKKIKISLPPLNIQEKIILKLDKIFSGINQIIKSEESNLSKYNNLKEVFLNNQFEKNSDFTSLGSEVRYDKIQGKGSKLPYLGLENITSETMELLNDVKVPESTSSTFKFDNTHLLYGRLRPYLKKIFLPSFKGQCSTEIFCIKPSENIDRSYLAYWLLSPSVLFKIKEGCTGARMPRANMKELLNFDFPNLGISEQKKISKKIENIFIKIEKLKDITKKKIRHFNSLKAIITMEEFNNTQYE